MVEPFCLYISGRDVYCMSLHDSIQDMQCDKRLSEFFGLFITYM